MDLLSEIIASKRQALDMAKRTVSLELMRRKADDARASSNPKAFSNALRNGEGRNIIAEFKRRSPSKGVIRENADAVMIARGYELAGAAALSVLTEENYFHGSLDDLREIRKEVLIPILRKDFIFDEYQVYESAQAGADALLLIVAALDDETLVRLRRLAEEELGLDALVEVHTQEEMERAVASGARLIGVNNRDLRTFNVSTQTSAELAQFAPPDAVLVSESGLTPQKVGTLQAAGYKGFLVGEALMRAADPGRELQLFRDSV